MISFDLASNSEWKNAATLIIWMTQPKVITENVILQVSDSQGFGHNFGPIWCSKKILLSRKVKRIV